MNECTGLGIKDRGNPQHFLKILVNSNSLSLKNMQPAVLTSSSEKVYSVCLYSGNDKKMIKIEIAKM